MTVDALDRAAMHSVVETIAPDAVVHLMTSIPPAIRPRRLAREPTYTNCCVVRARPESKSVRTAHRAPRVAALGRPVWTTCTCWRAGREASATVLGVLRLRTGTSVPVRDTLGAVGVDLFLADLLGDLLLRALGLGAQAHPLLRDGFLAHHRVLLVEHHLVLLLGDLGTVVGGVGVVLGDRLALETDLFVRDRHGLGHVLGDDVLAEPRAAPLAGLRPDVQLLLRAGHGLVGGRAGGVVADRPLLARAPGVVAVGGA